MKLLCCSQFSMVRNGDLFLTPIRGKVNASAFFNFSNFKIVQNKLNTLTPVTLKVLMRTVLVI